MLSHSIHLCVVLLVLINCSESTSPEDSCVTYAGGHVYPNTDRASGHSLQWTKAMSMLAH